MNKYFVVVFLTLSSMVQSLGGQNCNADFTFTVSGCNVVSFAPANSSPNLTYTWDFGDGNNSSESNPSHTFISFGNGNQNFTVRLTVNGDDCNEASSTQTVSVQQVPDAAITDPSGNNFINCTSGMVTIENASTTTGSNTNYVINWGVDGVPNAETTNFSTLTHTYFLPGQYNIEVTVTGSNGCVHTETTSFIFSSTPAIGAALASLAPICLPGSAPIDIVGVSNNTPNTRYILQANDGSPAVEFSHPPPSTVQYPFSMTACGTTSTINNSEFMHAFQVSIRAETGCPNQNASAAVGPIRTVNTPSADFEINPMDNTCQTNTFQFTNTSETGLFWESSTNECTDALSANWSIVPNNGYNIVAGSLTDSAGFSADFTRPGNYTIRLVVQNNFNQSNTDPFCGDDVIEKSICILADPVADFSINDDAGCFPHTIVLTNESNTLDGCKEASYSWNIMLEASECAEIEDYDFINDTDANSIDPEIRFNEPGIYNISLTVSNECGDDTFNQTVTVETAAIGRLDTLPTFCDNATINPTVLETVSCDINDQPSYSWQFPGGTPSTGNGLNPGEIQYDEPGTYSIILTTNNDCGPSETTTSFVIFPSPPQPVLTANTPCNGSSIQINASGSAELQYSWTGPNGFTSNEQNPIIGEADASTRGVYSVTVTDPNSLCTSEASIDVTVADLIPVRITPDDPDICIGQSITLNATGASSYTWTADECLSLNSATGDQVEVSANTSCIGTYRVIVVGQEDECTNQDTIEITVFDLPTMTTDPNQTICVGSADPLVGSPDASDGGTGFWTGDNISQEGIFSGPAGTHTVTYHYRNENGCEDSSSVNVCAIDNPIALFDVDQTNGCVQSGLDVQVLNRSNTLDACQAATFAWSVELVDAECRTTSDGWEFMNSDQDDENPQFRFTKSGLYRILLTVENICTTDTISQLIRIGEAPQVSIGSIDQACDNATINPTAEVISCNSPIIGYSWQFPNSTNTTSSNEESPTNIQFGPGTHEIILTVENDCGTTEDRIEFTVLQGPSIDIALSNDMICKGDEISVINNSTGDQLLYTWSVTDPNGATIDEPSSDKPTITFNEAGNYTVTGIISNPVCDGLTFTAQVTVGEAPTVDLNGIENFCEIATFTPTANFSEREQIDSVRWIFPEHASPATSTEFEPGLITIDTTGNYTLQVWVYNGCGIDSSTQSFSILEGPNLDIQIDTTFACVGESIGITNTSTGDNLQYNWSASDQGVQISNSAEASPSFTFNTVGTFTLTGVVSNPVCDGLTYTVEVTISEPPTVDLNEIENFCETASFTPTAIFSATERIDSVRWIFPEHASPATSTEFEPGLITLDTTGNYTLEVWVYNGCGIDSSTQSFSILEGPNLDIQIDTTFACVGESIGINNTSTGDNLQYNWSASDQSVEISNNAEASPSFTFNTVGTFTLTGVVSNPVCDGLTYTVEVTISEPPTVDLDEIENFCETASFTPTAIFSATERIDSVRWIFPEHASPATSTEFEPGLITLDTTGNYTVEVWVYNGCGIDSSTQSFSILEGPNLDIQIDTTFACVGESIGINNTSTGDNLQYNWSASDQSVEISNNAEASPSFTFNTVGTFTLTGVVSNPVCDGLTYTVEVTISEPPTVDLDEIEDFCETASFTPTAIFSARERIDSVRWIFPEHASPTTSTEFEPGLITIDTTGNYTVEVWVYNGCGIDSSTQSFSILEGPNLDIQIDTTFACVGESIGINNTSTGDNLQYNWSASDQSVEISNNAEASPSFTFNTVGTFTLTGVVSNPVCDGLTYTVEVTISEPPTVDLDEIEDFCETASFTPTAIFSARERIDSVRWIFPEHASPTTSTEFEPGLITIDTTGNYTVGVWVYNGCGIDSSTQSFSILAGPNLDIQIDTTFACVGESIGITNLSTGDNLIYDWSASDPSVSISDLSIPEPEFTFDDVGTFTITAVISSPVCESIIWTETVIISEIPEVSLDPFDRFCGEANINPVPTYQNLDLIDSVRWFFPDGQPETSTELDPDNVFYDSPGNYTVTIIAYNGCGQDSVSQTFNVFEPIEIGATVDNDFSCSTPFSVQVTNTTVGDELNYLWEVEGPHADQVSFESDVRDPMFVFQDTGIYIIFQKVFNEVCGELSWRDTISILSTPTLQLSPAADFCQEVQLSPAIDYGASRLDSVRWSFPGGAPSTSAEFNPQNIGYSGAGTYIYTLTAYNICGSSIISDTFVIDTIPILDVGPTEVVCLEDGEFQIPTPEPPGGTWSGLGIIDSEAGLFDPSLTGGGTHIVTYTFVQGECQISADKEITVIDLSNVEGGPDVSTCVSVDTIQLTGGDPPGGWYTGPGIVDSINGLFTPSALGSGDYNITYFYQQAGTDCIGSDDFLVTVHPLPSPIIQDLDDLCVNIPTPLASASIGATSFEWTIFGADTSRYSEENPVHIFDTTGFVDIRLVVTSEAGCVDSTFTQVFVSGPPIPRFAKDTSMGCPILPVNFTNESIGYENVEYFWDFGNGMTSVEETPGTVYYQQGRRDTTYYISLRVTNHCGTATYTDSVTVFPNPIPLFDINQYEDCEPFHARFNNFSEGLPESFLWNLGNGTTSTDSIAPDQVYFAMDSMNVIYTIELTAFNQCGDSTLSREILVKPDDIRAFFSADVTSGCEPLSVNFSNSTSPDSAIVYNWFFGDGNTSIAKDTTYTFYAMNDTITNYVVTLVADNGCGEDSATVEITVFPAPEVSYEAPIIACARDSVPFFNTSLGVSGTIWDFGDGDTSLATNPVHIFALPGTYQVSMTSFAADTGCPNTVTKSIEIRDIPEASMTASPLFGCPPLQVSFSNLSSNADFYTWDFGDGNSAVGQSPPPHTYTESGTYLITLTATDEFGCSDDTTFAQVIVYPVPIADFEIEQDTACGLPQNICLRNTSVGADGFGWTFGAGGSPSTENEPCVVYDAAGSYDIQLTATNQFLCQTSITKTFTAYDIPFADLEAVDSVICTDTRATFLNRSENASFAQWYFSDLAVDTNWNGSYVFTDTGFYDLTLVVGNGSGCTDTLELNDFIMVNNRPEADFYFDKIDNDPPTTYAFFDSSSTDVTYFFWDFDDGTVLEVENPIHRFLSSFDKRVTHIVANPAGCRDTVSKVVNLDTLTALFIPNALSPEDKDSEKQIFLSKGIGLSDYHIAVYNRTGQLLWESTQIDHEGIPLEGWNGTVNGKPMPSGTYVWKVIRANFIDGTRWDGTPDENGRLRRSGFLYLIR